MLLFDWPTQTSFLLNSTLGLTKHLLLHPTCSSVRGRCEHRVAPMLSLEAQSRKIIGRDSSADA